MRFSVICFVMFFFCGCGSHQEEPSQLKYETDNLTDRAALDSLEDALVEIDAYVNEQMEFALLDLPPCEDGGVKKKQDSHVPNVLYTALKRHLIGRDFFARVITAIEKWVEENEDIAKREIPLKNSLYRSVDVFDWTLIPISGIAPIIKVNGVIMGSDKLGHFFADGNDNFETYIETGDMFKALNVGIKNEEGLYGKDTTGVKSYGDLAANYAGLRFWMSVWSIAGTNNPYVVCKNNRYQKVRTFTWADYVNEAWDEGINCSEYRNSGLGQRFEQDVLNEMKRQNISCPISIDACKEITEFEFAPCFVSPKCWRLAHKNPPACSHLM